MSDAIAKGRVTSLPSYAASSRKRHYWERRAKRQCVDCAAGLIEGDMRVRCLECREAAADYRRTYARNGGRAAETAAQRERRRRHDANGRCRYCGKPRDDEERKMCSNCRYQHKLWRSGLSVAAYPRDERAPALHAKHDGYQPLDELEQNFRVRILRALWWLSGGGDWSDTREIFQAANVADDSGSRERNSAQVSLGRLVKLGLVERRSGSPSEWADYRITAAGRAEVVAYRRGNFPVMRGRRRAA